MKRLNVILILFVLAAVAGLPLLAQSSKPANATPPAPVVRDEVAEVPRISQQEFLKLFRDGAVTVIDVRDKTAYERGHIPGAIWMSQADFETRSKQLPTNKPIVTYCSWSHEQSSARVALNLQKAGVKKVYALLGGLSTWTTEGRAIVTGPNPDDGK